MSMLQELKRSCYERVKVGKAGISVSHFLEVLLFVSEVLYTNRRENV